ncbi:hypothetical protein [Anaerospora hongkongensis]|uniref:hypothetical protein n=1 Tax=Anaerospora hongkongensis TaxID=244830 RepID=UPI0028A02E33|nr:hypothetical protein [Anaerospora hongkongensis]
MANLKAGIGDPYWYEWSVGLLYSLDMLNPDNNIRHVILQESQLQGLDDVVVVYNDDHVECIQIKHTRENDTLTFSDMTSKSDEKESYLRRFCTDWVKAQAQYTPCKAILFTNRNIGTNKYTKDSWERPALQKFWSELKTKVNTATSISDISMSPEWQSAWEQWLGEMSELSDDKKLIFLRNFDIKSNQEDLDEIINSIAQKLSQYFKTDQRKAVQLHQKLCYALMEWATTLRRKEEITREDLLAALSLGNDEIQGEHNLATCEPFFLSRIEFAKRLEKTLQDREAPIVFLSGEPGVGKTNIVSYIANKIDSVITLRFHAFKPLTSTDLYLSADSGISDPKALWGNLLIELRGLLKGRLSKYCVPVSNELLASVDEIRIEVLRLSSALADETGMTTVIAIDGIDHAARVGSRNTFLQTLVPPEGVPEKICFLISGQPIHQYDQYPDWLADSDRVLRIDVPSIDEYDIKQLYDKADIKIPQESAEAAVKLINETITGNTLSAVFAIHEAKQCNSIEDLEKQLECKQLSSGISAYYEYIWKSAKENIPAQFFYVDTLLAGVFSLVNKKVTTKLLTEICIQEKISEMAWQRVLQLLYPIVIASDGAFRVFHNDVRIYFEKYIRKDKDSFISVADRLADYYILKSDDIKIKHEIMFGLLKYANRDSEYIDVFTREYVIEAIKAKRPLAEIFEQLEDTLRSLLKISDLKKILKFSCAVATLYQYKQSLQWLDKAHEAEVELPVVLNSEKRVIPRALITPSILMQMLEDTQLLISYGELARAQNNLNRWLGELTPESVQQLLMLDHGYPDGRKRELDDDIASILELWGRLAQHINVNVIEALDNQVDPEKAKLARRFFAKGWLDEGKNFLNERELENTISKLRYYFTDDLEDYIHTILDTNNETLILRISQTGLRDKFSKVLRVKFVVWSLINNKQAVYSEWISEIVSERFNYIKLPEDTLRDLSRELFPVYSLIALILSYCGLSDKTMIQECLVAHNRGQNFTSKDRGHPSAYNLILASSFYGYMLEAVNHGQQDSIEINDFKNCVTQLLRSQDGYVGYSLNADKIEAFLLKNIIMLTDKLDSTFQNSLLDIFTNVAWDYRNIRHINIYWNYLKTKSQTAVLEALFDKWMSVDGLVWQQESADMDKVAREFIDRAVEMSWMIKAETAKKCLDSKLVSYTGRKEYSIYSLLDWYERISTFDSAYWASIGVNLLNVSQYASDTGDNRADIYVDATVAVSAGQQGAAALWNFANLKDVWDENWVRRIFDGVIAALERNVYTKKELLTIWKLSTEVFFVYETADEYDSDNTLNSIYISDIKEAILLAAARLGHGGIENPMVKIAQLEFSQVRDPNKHSSFKIPTRWFDPDEEVKQETASFIQETNSFTCLETLDVIEERFYSAREQKHLVHLDNNDRVKFNWDYVVQLVDKIKNNPCENIQDYIPRILDLLLRRYDAYFWEWDGANRLYEVIFEFLNEDQITAVLNDMIGKYFELNEFSQDSKLFGLNSDLDKLTYSYYSRLSEADNVAAINELLKMHMDWITGDRSLVLTAQYKEKEDISCVTSWDDFCKALSPKIQYI